MTRIISQTNSSSSSSIPGLKAAESSKKPNDFYHLYHHRSQSEPILSYLIPRTHPRFTDLPFSVLWYVLLLSDGRPNFFFLFHAQNAYLLRVPGFFARVNTSLRLPDIQWRWGFGGSWGVLFMKFLCWEQLTASEYFFKFVLSFEFHDILHQTISYILRFGLEINLLEEP